MKFLILPFLISLSFAVNAQIVLDKFSDAGCLCAEKYDYAEYAQKFRESNSENERVIYDEFKEDYWATKRCIKEELRRTLTQEDQNGPRPKEAEFSEALDKKCPDVEFVFAACKRIDWEIFDEEMNAEVKADYDKVQEVRKSGDVEATLAEWETFTNIHGASNTYVLEYIAYAYEVDKAWLGNLMSEVVLEALEHGLVSDYRTDQSTSLHDFVVNSIVTQAEKHGQTEVVEAAKNVEEFKE